jgi:hypothetical protein
MRREGFYWLKMPRHGEIPERWLVAEYVDKDFYAPGDPWGESLQPHDILEVSDNPLVPPLWAPAFKGE